MYLLRVTSPGNHVQFSGKEPERGKGGRGSSKQRLGPGRGRSHRELRGSGVIPRVAPARWAGACRAMIQCLGEPLMGTRAFLLLRRARAPCCRALRSPT